MTLLDISREQQEIASAPVAQPGAPVGRCGICGQLSSVLVPFDSINTQAGLITRYKGACCGAK